MAPGRCNAYCGLTDTQTADMALSFPSAYKRQVLSKGPLSLPEAKASWLCTCISLYGIIDG